GKLRSLRIANQEVSQADAGAGAIEAHLATEGGDVKEDVAHGHAGIHADLNLVLAQGDVESVDTLIFVGILELGQEVRRAPVVHTANGEGGVGLRSPTSAHRNARNAAAIKRVIRYALEPEVRQCIQPKGVLHTPRPVAAPADPAFVHQPRSENMVPANGRALAIHG